MKLKFGSILCFIAFLGSLAIAKDTSIGGGGGLIVIDKGGGFAELQVLTLDQQLANFISNCPDKSCSSLFDSPEQRAWFLSELRTQPQLPLHFASTCGEAWEVVNGQILLPSCLLYENESGDSWGPRAQPFESLLATAFATRFTYLRGTIEEFEAVRMRARKTFESVKLAVQTTPIIGAIKPLRLHVWGPQNWWFKQSYLVIESLNQSQEISELVSRLPLCRSDLKSWHVSIDGAEVLQREWIVGHGSIEWECHHGIPNKFNARLRLVLKAVGEGVELSSSQATIKLVTEVP